MDLMTDEPIPFVTIRIEGTNRGTITNENGEFIIEDLCDEESNLVVSHVGYKQLIHHHDPYHTSPIIMLALDDQLLESVVVEESVHQIGNETLTSSKLTKKDLSDFKTESFGDVVSSLSGVSTLSTGQNIVKPIIHGLHSNRVLIINNGVRHEFQNWGLEHAPEIDPSLASSIEVIKGAAAVRYGPDALGGVILVNSADMELSSGFKGEVGSSYKSNGRTIGGNIELQQGWQDLVIIGGGSWTRQGDLHAPEYQLTNTGKREYSYSGGFRYHKDRFDLEGYYSHFTQDLGILRAAVNGNLEDLLFALESEEPPNTKTFSYDINSPKQAVQHDLIKLKGSYVLDNQDFSFQYAFQHNDRQEFDVRRGSLNERPAIDLILNTHSIDFDWNHPDLGRWFGQVGIQWTYQDNKNQEGTNTIPFVPNFDQTRVGVYAIESIDIGQSTLELGARYDYQFLSVIGRDSRNDLFRNELTYAQLTASAGIVRNWNNLSFRSNLGTAWRPPNVSELYSFGRHQATFEYGLWRFRENDGTISTDRVLSEDDKEVPSEVGFKWINNLSGGQSNLNWEITGYANVIKNYIFTKPLGITNTVRGVFPYYVYDQNDALFLGLDLATEKELGTSLRGRLKSSYLFARQLPDKDKFVGMPPLKFDVGLDYEKRPGFLKSSNVSINLSYTFRQFDAPRVVSVDEILAVDDSGATLFGNDNSDFDILREPDGFLLVDASWSASSGQWNWQLGVKNVLNTSYRRYTDRLRYFADQTGRNFHLSVRYKL